MTKNKKNILRAVFSGSIIALILAFSIIGCVKSKPVKAESIQMTTIRPHLNFYINTGELRQFGQSGDTVNYGVVDENGYAMRFTSMYQNAESFYYNKHFYIRIMCQYWDGYFMNASIMLYNNNQFNGSPIRTIDFYDMGGTASAQNVSDDDYKAFNSGLVMGGYFENGYFRGDYMDDTTTSFALFSVFFTLKKSDFVENMEEYNKGYDKGVIDGQYRMQQDILSKPNEYGLYSYNDLMEKYNDGIALGEEGTAKSVNWFTGIFTALSQVFNIKIFGGSITLGMLCMIPFSIEFVFVIFKIIRGGE